MTITETHFEDELEAYRRDSETAAQSFYAYQAISYLSTRDKAIYNLLVSNGIFWNINMQALIDATFIALDRVFDTQSQTHNIFRLLQIAEDNSHLFKISSPRWAQGNGNKTKIYEPQPRDWHRLCGHVCKWNSMYREKYKPIRDKFLAHDERMSLNKRTIFIEKTHFNELEKLFAFLDAFYEALYRLYDNGAKPIIRYRRYSLLEMLAPKTTDRINVTAGERVVLDAQKFLESYAKRMRNRKL